MVQGPVNRATLASHYQAPADVYDDEKTEACLELLADYIDGNYNYAAGLVSSGVLSRLGWYNVMDYGSEGDGVTDDTMAIQDAIDAAEAAGGGIIYLPKGDYLVTSTITILGDNISLIGSGRRSSRIVGSGATSPVLQIGASGDSVYRFKLADFMITRSLGAASKTGTIGLHYIKSAHADICTITNCSFNGSQYNVQSGLTTDRPEAFTVWTNCEFGNYDQNDDYAFYCVDGIEQKFIGCRFQGFDEIGFYVPSYPTSGNPNDWVFDDCYFGSVSYSFGGNGADYCVRIRGGFAYFFNNCIFEQGKEANISIEAGKIHKFTNCLIGGSGYTGNGIVIFGGVSAITQVSIIGGEIRDVGQANSNYNGTGRCLYLYPSTNGASKITISGVTMRSEAYNCIRYDVDYLAVTGCSLFQNSDVSAILATANADTATITGNVIDCSAVVTSGNSPIVLNAGTGGQVVVGNSIIKGGATVGVANSGDASNVVANNATV